VAYIAQALRRAVIARAHGRCEYCQTAQAIVVEMEVDHVIPESADGATNLDTLCLTCVSCNGFKLAFQTGTDPETREEAPLFHPRNQRWDDHFAWSENRLYWTSDCGRMAQTGATAVAGGHVIFIGGGGPPAMNIWSEDGIRILGLTPTGRATVARLPMNRERMVEARRLWVAAG
jgi:hypothetical protein